MFESLFARVLADMFDRHVRTAVVIISDYALYITQWTEEHATAPHFEIGWTRDDSGLMAESGSMGVGMRVGAALDALVEFVESNGLMAFDGWTVKYER